MAHTKGTLRQDLVAMGLTGTETILIHSSMKSIGEVEGGAATTTRTSPTSPKIL